MSHLEELRKSKDKPQVAFQEFALSTSKYPNHLFCFFEGKDNSYYVPRIKRFTEEYLPIICGGKKSVLDVHLLISNKSEYTKYKLGFFVDSDFNPPLEDLKRPVFETTCYSIENYYTSPTTFEQIVINEFHISRASDEIFIDIIELYINRQNEFHAAILLLNAWYYCLIKRKEKGDNTIIAPLGEKPPHNFIDIQLDHIDINYDINKIKAEFSGNPEITNTEIEDAKTKLIESGYHKTFRGKYELYFLIKFIKLLLSDSYTHKKIIKQKLSFSFGDGSTLNHLQVLNVFEGYAETPQSLLDYLEVVNS